MFRRFIRAFRKEWTRQTCERRGHDWTPMELVRETESGIKFWSMHCQRQYCPKYVVGDAEEMDAVR